MLKFPNRTASNGIPQSNNSSRSIYHPEKPPLDHSRRIETTQHSTVIVNNRSDSNHSRV